MKYRKKPVVVVVVEATEWIRDGDHNKVKIKEIESKDRFVRCGNCGSSLSIHGWIDTLEGGHIVCPGDWIVTKYNGKSFPCHPDIFEKTYEKVEE